MIASTDLIDHIIDHPWPGCKISLGPVPITFMSSGIATMIIVGIVLIAVILLMARRRGNSPNAAYNAIEVLVIFVRDRIAAPALGKRAYEFLPMLMTLFVFVMGMNLMGLVPLEPVSLAVAGMLGFKGYSIGGSATSIPAVCCGLAAISLLAIVFCGLGRTVKRYRASRNWPWWLAWILSPALWLMSLSPDVPGVVGKILTLPLALLELVGAAAKCFALLVRLFANMVSGHTLLAVLLMFTLQVATMSIQQNAGMLGVGIICVLVGVVVSVMELLVAALQAYIFTFLTAMYLGLYVEPEH